MKTYQTHLFVNTRVPAPIAYGSAQKALLNQSAFAEVAKEVTSWPNYQRTPLYSLSGFARASGVAGLWCKHEGYRFGLGSFKPTGPTYAMLAVLKGEVKKVAGVQTVTTQDLMNRRYESVTYKIVVSAATSGNHGRALAWGARMFGCRCVVYMNEGVSVGRERAIADYGAEVVRVPGNYDQAVIRSYKDAETLGYFVISDYESATYPNVPRDIMQGYAMVADEIIDQFTEQLPPTHVFVPGGGGRLAGAICGHLWERYAFHRPRVIIVEPTESACLYQSALQGYAATVSKEGRSVMDGLVVESASPQAWTVLSKGAFAFLTIPDAAAIDAMQQAASGVDGDLPCVIGDTGIAGWAGFLAVTSDEYLRRQLDLDTSSRVVIIATEGATDPKVYENIVGTRPDRIDIKRI